MDTKLRPSGIEGFGDAAWGTHFCLFYENKEDLLDILIPYFKVGLENNEFFLCVASPPLSTEETRRAMREAVPDFERYLAEGQIEIVSYRDWLLTGGQLDIQRVLQNWIAKLNWALAKGYAGLRFAGDPSWPDKQAWGGVPEFEKQLDQIVSNSQMLGLCVYALERCSARDMLDVVNHHQFTVAKRNGVWEYLEGSELKRAHDEIRQLNAVLEGRVKERTAQLEAANEQLTREVAERKEAEAQLHAQEQEYRAIVENAPDQIIRYDRNLHRVYVNPAVTKDYGLPKETFIGKPIGSIVADARLVVDKEEVDAQRRRIQAVFDTGEPTESEVTWPLPDSRRTFWSRLFPEFDPNGDVISVLGIARDITERKRAEDALRRSEEYLRLVIDTIPIMIWSVRPDGTVDFLNQRWMDYTGLSLEQFVEEPTRPIHPEDIPRVREKWLVDAAAGKPYEDEMRLQGVDGEYRWFLVRTDPLHDESGKIVKWYGVSTDIDDRKRAEEALQETKSNLELILDNSPLPILGIDPKGRITSWNKAAERVFGWTADEVLGRVCQTIPAEEMADFLDLVRKVMQGETFLGLVRYRQERGGALLTCSISLAPQRNGRSEPIGVTAIVEDITERKYAEEALRKSEQVLREAESLGHTGSWEQNLVTGEIFNTEENLRLFFGDDHSKGADFEDYAEVVHPDDREYVMQRRMQLLAERGPSDIEYRVVWPDGSIHVLFGRATVVYDELGQAIRVYGTNVDITERKQAEEEIRRYATRMEALAGISRTFVEAGLDYQGILNTVAQRTAELIGDSCVITLFSDDAQRSFPVAFYHTNPNALSMMHEALLHTWQGGTDTQRYQTLLAGNSIYISSVNPEEFRASLEPEFGTYFEAIGISSVLIVPLKTQSHIIGTLGITRDRQGAPYTREDLILLENIADRAAMSIQNARLFEQVQGAREQLEALSRRLLKVQEAERRALTTELHDRVGQNLTGLSINLQNMKALLSKGTVQALATKFDDAQALLEHITRQIRDIMAELHPPELEDYGLAVALETYAERFASRGNLELIANLPDLAPPPLPSDVRIALFRAAQEAISNVLKHADATQLEISLQGEDGRVRLRVEDDGQGFEPDAASQKEAPSWGLKIMRERIESIGGKVQIESEPGQGTRVTFEIERPS